MGDDPVEATAEEMARMEALFIASGANRIKNDEGPIIIRACDLGGYLTPEFLAYKAKRGDK